MFFFSFSFFFFLYTREGAGKEGGTQRARWITERFTAVHKTRNSRVCAPPAGVKLAKPNVFHPIYIIRLSIKTLLKLIYTPMHHPSGHVSNKVGLEKKNLLNTNIRPHLRSQSIQPRSTFRYLNRTIYYLCL